MKRESYDTVNAAITDLRKQGYTNDFSISNDKGGLVCHKPALKLSSEEFEIDDFYRFDGETDSGDEMIVYAISSNNKNLKGILVKAYGIYAENSSSAIVKKLVKRTEKGSFDIIEKITHYFQNDHDKKDKSSPEGTCPICWGKQEYDGKIREVIKDKQIDVNNHKESYMIIQDFMKDNIDGNKLQSSVEGDCPDCSPKKEKDDH